MQYPNMNPLDCGSSLIPYLVSYIIMIIFSNYLICRIVRELWKPLGIAADPESPRDKNRIEYVDISSIIGYVERTLYWGAILIAKPEFIGIWLTLKVAGRIWGRSAVSNKATESASLRPSAVATYNNQESVSRDKTSEELDIAWRRENKGKDSYIYQVFLIGSALSLTYAVIGAKSIIWYQSANYCFAFAMPMALIFATVVLLLYIKKIN